MIVFEVIPAPPTIELVAHVAKSAYADWEMEIDRNVKLIGMRLMPKLRYKPKQR